MFAARRLYPDAVVCVSAALNRNVREFYRLHADELDAVEVSRIEPEAIRRLIVVETMSASRLGELDRDELAEIITEELPGLAMTISSELVPEIREYDRTSTTLANVYVKGIAARYLGR